MRAVLRIADTVGGSVVLIAFFGFLQLVSPTVKLTALT
jgi:hypothetical protein